MKLSRLSALDAAGVACTVLKTTTGQIADSELVFDAPPGVSAYSLESDGSVLTLNAQTGKLESLDAKQVYTLLP